MTLDQLLEEYRIVKNLLLRNVKNTGIEKKYSDMIDAKEQAIGTSLKALTKDLAKIFSDMKIELPA